MCLFAKHWIFLCNIVTKFAPYKRPSTKSTRLPRRGSFNGLLTSNSLQSKVRTSFTVLLSRRFAERLKRKFDFYCTEHIQTILSQITYQSTMSTSKNNNKTNTILIFKNEYLLVILYINYVMSNLNYMFYFHIYIYFYKIW